MSVTRLTSFIAQLKRKNLLERFTINRSQHTVSRIEDSDDVNEQKDKPIQYSTSPAATWKVKDQYSGESDQVPWFQGPIVNLSTFGFILYFLYLRESSDIDEKVEKLFGPNEFVDALVEHTSKQSYTGFKNNDIK